MIMKMVDTKLSKQTIKELDKPSTIGSQEYPYGLRLNFDQTMIEKIPDLADPNNLNVGDYVIIQAVGCIKSMSQSETDGEDKRSDLSIQIEKIGVVKRDDEAEGFKEATNKKE
jgi:hypothetical protein